MAPILAYWKMRGLAQPIRFLLEYTGEPYEDKFYEAGPPPDFDKSCWLSVKFNLGLPLPNLPYYIDGDVKMSESHAILRHFARKHDLYGQTEKDRMMIDMLMDRVKDMHLAFFRLCYNEWTPENKKIYLEKLPSSLQMLSNILGKQTWFLGDKINVPDFLLYEELDVNLALDPKCLDSFPNLRAFLKRFEELPAIKKFMASPRFIKKAINSPMAKFGYAK